MTENLHFDVGGRDEKNFILYLFIPFSFSLKLIPLFVLFVIHPIHPYRKRIRRKEFAQEKCINARIILRNAPA